MLRAAKIQIYITLIYTFILFVIVCFLTGCYQRAIERVKTVEIFKETPIKAKHEIVCRYQEAQDMDDLVNRLLECVINYEAYMKVLQEEENQVQ